MTLAQPVLIKRIDPDAGTMPTTGLNFRARIALWTILVFSAFSLARVMMNADASPQPAAHREHWSAATESRRTLPSPGGRAGRWNVAASSPRLSSTVRQHRPASSEGSHDQVPTWSRIAMGKGLAIRFPYQDAAGRLSLRLGYYGAAMSYFTEAIRKYPEDVRARDQRAALYWRTGQASLAAKDFANALRINAQDTTAMEGLAWLLSASPARAGRDQKRAVALAQQACILTGWRDSSALEALAAAYASAGAFDKAIKAQGQALALQHDSSRLAARLGLYAQHRTAGSTALPQL